MATASYRLESTWQPDGGANGRFTFTLFNLSDEPLSGFKLVYTSLTLARTSPSCGATPISTNSRRP
jgi:hexosaminidase